MSALKKYWTMGKLIKDDGKSVFSEDWVGVMKAADVEAFIETLAKGMYLRHLPECTGAERRTHDCTCGLTNTLARLKQL